MNEVLRIVDLVFLEIVWGRGQSMVRGRGRSDRTEHQLCAISSTAYTYIIDDLDIVPSCKLPPLLETYGWCSTISSFVLRYRLR
jgi:hypothetical protein